jgi:hypothetical protein
MIASVAGRAILTGPLASRDLIGFRRHWKPTSPTLERKLASSDRIQVFLEHITAGRHAVDRND